MNNCAKCQSSKIVPNAIVLDKGDGNYNHDFQIAVDAKPDAWVFKERHSTRVTAKVCGDCGFIEFYAVAPEELYETYLRSQDSR